MIFLLFLPSQRKLRTSFPIAFACVSGNEEGTRHSGWPGTISRKAAFMKPIVRLGDDKDHLCV